MTPERATAAPALALLLAGGPRNCGACPFGRAMPEYDALVASWGGEEAHGEYPPETDPGDVPDEHLYDCLLLGRDEVARRQAVLARLRGAACPSWSVYGGVPACNHYDLVAAARRELDCLLRGAPAELLGLMQDGLAEPRDGLSLPLIDWMSDHGRPE